MLDFKGFWNAHYPRSGPIGHMLRHAGARHWLRFHSLPESKRYAETDAERAILLARQNEIAGTVLGFDEPCWLVQSGWVVPEGDSDVSGTLHILDPITGEVEAKDPFAARRAFGLSFAFHFVAADDEIGWDVYAALTEWVQGKFDDLLWEIAVDRAAPTLWVTRSGAIFAPYDGGIDLFLNTSAMIEQLAAKHAGWLSPHPSGL